MKPLLVPFLLALLLLGNTKMLASDDYLSIVIPYNYRYIDSLQQVLKEQPLSEKETLKIFAEIAYMYHGIDHDSALFYAHKAIDIAQKYKEYKTLCDLYSNLGITCCFMGDYDAALVYLDKMKESAIKGELKDQELTAISYFGFTYAKQGKYNMAIEYYLKVLAMPEIEEYPKTYVNILTNISEINRRVGNTEAGILFLKRAEEKCEQLQGYPYAWNMKHVCNEYAFNYIKQGDWNKALYYALKADSLMQGQVNGCYTKGLLAQIYLQQGNYDVAMQYANASYEFAGSLDDKNLFAFSGKLLSDIYLAQKRYPEAEAIALKVWQTDSTHFDESRDIVENIVLANIYMGNMEKAAHFLKKYSELNTQFTEKSYHTIVSDLAVKYETEKKDIYITTLKAKQKEYFLTGAVIGTLLLLALVFLLFRYRLNVQKRKLIEQRHEIAEQKIIQLEQEKKLVATQAVLDGETAERSRLARDLHDGLGGMLSVVKLNLKDMKHFAIMDGPDVEHFGKALDMLDQSIGELRRVAHHIMPESLMRCGLKVSLEDFVHAIPNTHFQYFGDDLRLDSPLEILIYRCAYELINNAVKYAQATAINVQIIMDSGIVSLTVQDDGIGFDPQTVSAGMGLENIRTRLALYNGQMTIHTAPNEGTEVCIEVMIR